MTTSPLPHLVLEQGVPRDAASLLRELGYECTHVGELGMWNAADSEILSWALHKRATLVTLDANFHTILELSGAKAPSTIRVRMEGLRAPALAELIHQAHGVFGEI